MLRSAGASTTTPTLHGLGSAGVPTTTQVTGSSPAANTSGSGSTDGAGSSSSLGQVYTVNEGHDIAYRAASGLQVFDSFVPSGVSSPTPAVIFVHGGSWDGGSKSDLDPLAQAIAQVGWAGFSIDYRLDGFPNEVEDVLAAIVDITKNAAAFNVDPNRIAVLGTSAGANLASLAVTDARGLDGISSGVRAVVSWSGPMDLSTLVQEEPSNIDAMVARYLGCTYSACPSEYADGSPQTFASPGSPPFFLVNSASEVIPVSQPDSMSNALQSAGVTAPVDILAGSLHATQYAQTAFAPSMNWLETYLGPYRGTLPSISPLTGENP